MSVATLPSPTDDLDRAEHDLYTDGICAVTGVLTAATVEAARYEPHEWQVPRLARRLALA